MFYKSSMFYNNNMFYNTNIFYNSNIFIIVKFYKERFGFYGKTYDKKGEGTCWQDNAAS